MTRNRASVQSYFARYQNRFDLWGGTKEGKGFRECQLGAYWAVWAHFTTSSDPALVSLPTGSGKTALMMALAFGFAARRVLIITPGEVLREQIASEFRNLTVLRTIGTLPPGVPSPKVLSNETKLNTKDKWQELTDFDVITATPKSSSPGERGVCQPPPDLFDLIFLDEAHHTEAPTWAAILNAFKDAKFVLLTATPFRRDRRRIRAPLVYHYPIGRAIDKGIHRPVVYHPVQVGNNRANRDNALCETAKQVLDTERGLGNDSKLLIRVDRVDSAYHLAKLYEQHGVRVGVVEYEKTWGENQATIQAVRDNQLDGMICVGMLGEGLDLPALKIAVLHAAPRSLPFTIQFVGRISRIARNQSGNAHLIAVPDEVRGEIRQLYNSDADWHKLIPALVEQVIGKLSEAGRRKSSLIDGQFEISPFSIKPFFSTRIFEVQSRIPDLTGDLKLPNDVAVRYRQIFDRNLLVVITEVEGPPAWAQQTGMLEAHLALHVFYWQEQARLLFESSTADEQAKQIHLSLVGEHASLIPPDKVMRVMQKGKAGSYYMVGLTNVIGRGLANPAYKTMQGVDVQAAVRPTDGHTFAAGHALIRLSPTETRGIGTLHSRVWAIRRANIFDYRTWCEGLADEIRQKRVKPGLPQLRFLPSPQTIDRLPEKPLVILSDESLLQTHRRIEVAGRGTKHIVGDIIPYIEIKRFKPEQLECSFCFHSTEPGIQFSYSPVSSIPWEHTDKRDLQIRLEFSDTDIFHGSLIDYLQKYPPKLLMPKGGAIIGQQYWLPNRDREHIPDGCLQALDWQGCDIMNEVRPAPKGYQNIHDWLQARLQQDNHILIKDFAT